MQINGLYFKPKAKLTKIFKFIIKLRRFRINVVKTMCTSSLLLEHTHFFKKNPPKRYTFKKRCIFVVSKI